MSSDPIQRRSIGTQYGESSRGTVDEQTLYGEPCHELQETDDEKALYGEPQHESGGASEVRDVELLFVRMQNAPLRPDSLGSRTTSSSAETTD